MANASQNGELQEVIRNAWMPGVISCRQHSRLKEIATLSLAMTMVY